MPNKKIASSFKVEAAVACRPCLEEMHLRSLPHFAARRATRDTCRNVNIAPGRPGRG